MNPTFDQYAGIGEPNNDRVSLIEAHQQEPYLTLRLAYVSQLCANSDHQAVTTCQPEALTLTSSGNSYPSFTFFDNFFVDHTVDPPLPSQGPNTNAGGPWSAPLLDRPPEPVTNTWTNNAATTWKQPDRPDLGVRHSSYHSTPEAAPPNGRLGSGSPGTATVPGWTGLGPSTEPTTFANGTSTNGGWVPANRQPRRPPRFDSEQNSPNIKLEDQGQWPQDEWSRSQGSFSPQSTQTTSPTQIKKAEPQRRQRKQSSEPRKKPRRKAHNAIERRYRIKLNEKIAELRDSIPTLRQNPMLTVDGSDEDMGERVGEGVVTQKVNKANILEKATEYVKHLEARNQNLEAELRRIISLTRSNHPRVQRNDAFSSHLITGHDTNGQQLQPLGSSIPAFCT